MRTADIAPELLAEHRRLCADDYNTYNANHFPGSRGWNIHQQAEQALREFNAAHPEVQAAKAAERQAKLDAERAEREADPYYADKILGM